ncbi:MATE efflux family protein [Rhizoclosmatium globosum]|uniref:MATE efflux family protein n=1 Tax=Rhizoclosmatium globosum TaxID=329046 RepID=A0A1Y2CBV4_9FUNG|nr:MATE efflux family protein [Rhizoclosmatium globosum]|eukprot:ORY43805.1 MATE efflux family protein [Rhizoclosmatium globosum]
MTSRIELPTAPPDEETPLLHRDSTVKICRASVIKEAKELVPLAFPVSIGYLLQIALASMALATLFANVTGYSLIVGLGAAIDTLCSQSYGEYLSGTGSKRELGRHLSRSIFLMYLTCIPVAILWWFTEPLLLLAGQDPEIARLSGKYTLLLIPSLVPFVISESVKRFLMSQGIMSAQMVVIGIVAPINCLLQYIFVFTSWSLGEQGEGSPFALMIIHTLIAIALVWYAARVEGGDAFVGWEWNEVLNGRKLWMTASLGMSGVLMTCSEWWAWEIVALIAGLLGPEYLAAQTIVLSASYWTYTMPLGFAIASTTRIGNSLGSGAPDQAQLSAFVAIGLGLFLAGINSTAFMLGRESLGYLFSDDKVVIDIVAEIIPLVATFQIADVMACIAGGILRGAGRPDIGAFLNLIGYYVLGIPFGIFYCFYFDWKLYGLWSGLTTSLFFVSFIEICMIWRLDWNMEAENAHKRSLENLSS